MPSKKFRCIALSFNFGQKVAQLSFFSLTFFGTTCLDTPTKRLHVPYDRRFRPNGPIFDRWLRISFPPARLTPLYMRPFKIRNRFLRIRRPLEECSPSVPMCGSTYGYFLTHRHFLHRNSISASIIVHISQMLFFSGPQEDRRGLPGDVL